MIRVASYCRVSTDQSDQANSFVSQKAFFKQYIENRPDWTLYEIYADEGITGTSTNKRTQFNRMIRDARAGRFQLIITKEVSRFSRNILDTIAYTRELKASGVGVIFVLDGIDTRNPDAELYLSIMGSMAQEESRKTSSRVVWGQTRQMERGVVFGPSLLGYTVTAGKITIEPQGAETVRLIFRQYALEQKGATQIARYLTEHGCVTSRGHNTWSASTVVKILKNEKYVGDLIQKKTFTPDYLTHEKKRNTGQVPLIYLPAHHEPIISREIWALTQERLQKNNKRTPHTAGHSDCYALSGKIKCGQCGASFVCRTRYLKNGKQLRYWRCSNAANCKIGTTLRDDDARQMIRAALENLAPDPETVVQRTTNKVWTVLQSDADSLKVTALQQRTQLQQKKERVLDSYFAGVISQADMQVMVTRYNEQLALLEQRFAEKLKPAPCDVSTKQNILQELTELLQCEENCDVFLKTILEQITVGQQHLILQFRGLEQVFQFSR